MKLYTIGFTGKTAEEFFSLLKDSGVRKIIDTRRNNASQLAAFARASDLPYFLKTIADIGYEHRLDMAPSQELLTAYRNKEIDWPTYHKRYLKEITANAITASLQAKELDRACLLCSEHEPDHCHRTPLAQHLKKRFPDLQIIHLIE